MPLTPAGEAAWKHNTTATVDPESHLHSRRHPTPQCERTSVHGYANAAVCCVSLLLQLLPPDSHRCDASIRKTRIPHSLATRWVSWDGDALVIDSVGFKDTQVWADENGSPHSDALHVIERWTRPDAQYIHVETTIEDPKFYTKPFSYSRTWEAGAPGDKLAEYSCAENPVDRDIGIWPWAHPARRNARLRQRCAATAASATARAYQEIASTGLLFLGWEAAPWPKGGPISFTVISRRTLHCD